MDRTIRVTSDEENVVREVLVNHARVLERKVQLEFHLYTPLFSDIFLAINPDGDEKVLGRFYSKGKYIVINESLIREDMPIETIINIVKHELAHAMDFAINGTLSGHSQKFRSYCAYLAIDEGFDKAKIRNTLRERQNKEERIRKLLTLTTSPFENEAMIALSKAQKLMLESSMPKEKKDKEKLYITDLYEAGRIAYSISKLTNFISRATGAYVVQCRVAKGHTIIRLYGSLSQIELSIYLFDYLYDNLNLEIAKLRKQGEAITKDSFLMGAIPEMEKKLLLCDENTNNALVAVHRENEEKTKRLVFKKGLRNVKHSARNVSSSSYKFGSEFAQKLDIPKTIGQKKIT